MFNLIEDLAKAASAAVALPAAVAADVVTLGGTLAGQQKPFTAQALDALVENVDQTQGAGPADKDSPRNE